MELLYNIYFEVAAAAFLLLSLIYLRIQYTAKERSAKKFRTLVAMVILADVLDVVTAIMISYASVIPALICQLGNTAYFVALLWTLYLYIDYIGVFMKHKINVVIDYINKILFATILTLLLVNIKTGWMFSFNTKGEYVHGPLYMSLYGLSMYLLIESVVISIINRKHMQKRQFGSIIFFCIMLTMGTVLQVCFFPNTLLNIFFASLAMMVIMFALETPDYLKLSVAMDELKRTAEALDIARKDAEDAMQEAEMANRAKSDFLASMSHEIRTPINGVLGMNSMILKEATDENILEYSQNIDSAGNGLLSLINDILDFSKIESGKMEIIPVEYQVSKLLSDAYNMVFMRARDKGLDLLFENNATIPNFLYGDETRVRQIIVNLLTNAIKYTEEGMVMLTADWEQGEKPDEMRLIISVKDTGIGIKKKNLDKLFDAFSRVDQTRNRNIEGTGLGLKITKQFLDMMGGTVTVESEYGSGSEFMVVIPQKMVSDIELGDFAKYSNISTDDKKVIANNFKCPRGRVLVVDDVEMNLKVFTGLLKSTELKIDTAMSGDECIAKIKEKTYDVIFLDHLMPHKDGIETLHEMKSMSNVFNPNIPVIMLTANAIQGVKDTYINEGFTDYLSKPVREEELNAVLIKYLPKELIEIVDDIKDENKTSENENVSPADEKPVDDIKEVATDDAEISLFEKRFHFLNVKAGMIYCLDNVEFYESIVREFRNSSRYDEIQDAYDEANLDNYAVLVHGVKSAALTIGANDVADLAKGLEFAANSGDIDYLKEHHYKFMMMYGELLDNLDEVYAG